VKILGAAGACERVEWAGGLLASLSREGEVEAVTREVVCPSMPAPVDILSERVLLSGSKLRSPSVASWPNAREPALAVAAFNGAAIADSEASHAHSVDRLNAVTSTWVISSSAPTPSATSSVPSSSSSSFSCPLPLAPSCAALLGEPSGRGLVSLASPLSSPSQDTAAAANAAAAMLCASSSGGGMLSRRRRLAGPGGGPLAARSVCRAASKLSPLQPPPSERPFSGVHCPSLSAALSAPLGRPSCNELSAKDGNIESVVKSADISSRCTAAGEGTSDAAGTEGEATGIAGTSNGRKRRFDGTAGVETASGTADTVVGGTTKPGDCAGGEAEGGNVEGGAVSGGIDADEGHAGVSGGGGVCVGVGCWRGETEGECMELLVGATSRGASSTHSRQSESNSAAVVRSGALPPLRRLLTPFGPMTTSGPAHQTPAMSIGTDRARVGKKKSTGQSQPLGLADWRRAPRSAHTMYNYTALRSALRTSSMMMQEYFDCAAY